MILVTGIKNCFRKTLNPTLCSYKFSSLYTFLLRGKVILQVMIKFTGYGLLNYWCFDDKYQGKNSFTRRRRLHHQVCASENCFCQNLQLHVPGTDEGTEKTFKVCMNWPGLSRWEVISASVFLFPLPNQ